MEPPPCTKASLFPVLLPQVQFCPKCDASEEIRTRLSLA